jgi:AcrR family transcriptional regulator
MATARTLFVTAGYDEISTAKILDASGVSRGAMYYHYKSKEALFEEIYLQTRLDLAKTVYAKLPVGGSEEERVVIGVEIWLKAACRSDIAKILFEMGPAVLGQCKVRELLKEEAQQVAKSYPAEVAAGWNFSPYDMRTAITRAALDEAALLAAHSENPSHVIAQAIETIKPLMTNLQPASASP